MQKQENKYLIFSYGTLKRGFPNHFVMQKIGAVFIAEARTQYRYPLFVGGQWQVPFLIDQKDFPNSHIVEGEIFEVDTNGLSALDEFEGVGDGYYRRLLINVCLISNPQALNVWCYFGGKDAEKLLDEIDQLLSVYTATQVDEYTPVWDRQVQQ